MLEEEDLVIGAGCGESVPDVVESLVTRLRVEGDVEHTALRIRFVHPGVGELLHETLASSSGRRARAIDHECHHLLAHSGCTIPKSAGGLESNEMAKTWVLDSETKGTGARMVPLDDVLEKPKPAAPSRPPARAPARKPAGTTRPKRPVEKRSTPLPP